MAPLSARRLADMISLCARVAAIELVVAAQAAVAAKSAGFRAVKIRIGRTEPGISLDAVRATRAAVGERRVVRRGS